VRHRRPGQRSSRGGSFPNRVFRPYPAALSPSPLRPNLVGALRENIATLGGPAVARVARVSLESHPRFHLTGEKICRRGCARRQDSSTGRQAMVKSCQESGHILNPS
jgi:hypothetical protein